MATNPYVNKVISNNQTLIDLTADTVDAAHLLAGITAHDCSGAPIVGTASGGSKTISYIRPATVQVSTGNTVVHVSGRTNNNGVTYEIETDITLYGVSTDIKNYTLYRWSASSIEVRASNSNRGTSTSVTKTPTATYDTDGTPWATYASWSNSYTTLMAANANSYSASNPSSDKLARDISIDKNNAGVYIVTYVNGATENVVNPSPELQESQECLLEIHIDSVTAVIENKPGYIVTYTDQTTESFAALTADIADGSY
jgi:hypothetical protein